LCTQLLYCTVLHSTVTVLYCAVFSQTPTERYP